MMQASTAKALLGLAAIGAVIYGVAQASPDGEPVSAPSQLPVSPSLGVQPPPSTSTTSPAPSGAAAAPSRAEQPLQRFVVPAKVATDAPRVIRTPTNFAPPPVLSAPDYRAGRTAAPVPDAGDKLALARCTREAIDGNPFPADASEELRRLIQFRLDTEIARCLTYYGGAR